MTTPSSQSQGRTTQYVLRAHSPCPHVSYTLVCRRDSAKGRCRTEIHTSHKTCFRLQRSTVPLQPVESRRLSSRRWGVGQKLSFAGWAGGETLFFPLSGPHEVAPYPVAQEVLGGQGRISRHCFSGYVIGQSPGRSEAGRVRRGGGRLCFFPSCLLDVPVFANITRDLPY
jgi:hypothetical protein